MTTTSNGLNSVEDADMADCDGEKVVTMVDVLKEQEDFEEDANAVLGASDDKNCTYIKGYVKRQAIYACMTCCVDAKDDPSKRAGVCLACSLTCHENHELIELYTKRNFRCDCGNSNFNSHPCQFTPLKTDLNDNNNYNQNFSGLYCTCQRPYPDPESNVEDEMIQCIICEDWLHASHLDSSIPANEYSEMICKDCMEKNSFLYDYSDLAVNNESADIVIDVGTSNTQMLITNGNKNLSGNPSCSKEQTMADVDRDTKINYNENLDTLEKVSSNMNATEEQDNTMLEQNIDHNSTGLEAKDIVNIQSEVTKLENQTPETNKTINTAIISEELQKVLCDQDMEIADKESLTESTDKTGIKTFDRTDTSMDFVKESDEALNKQSLIDAEKMDEDRLLDDPSLEDNIKDLADLINDNNESDNNSKSTEVVNSTETSSEIHTQDKNAEEKDLALEESVSNKDLQIKMEIQESRGTDSNLLSDEMALKETVSNKDLHTEIKLPNSTGTESELPSDENTNAAVSIDIKESAEIAHSIDRIVTKDLKSEDNQFAEDRNESREHISNSPTTVVNSVNIKNDEKSNHLEFKYTNTSSDEVEVPQTHSNNEFEMNTTLNKSYENQSVELSTETFNKKLLENKRKLSTEDIADEKEVVKRSKFNEVKLCVRPRAVNHLRKGAMFWPPHFRQKLCTCNECLSMYKDLSVLFLIDLEDTVSFYENLGQEKVRIEGKPKSQYEKGLEALSSLDRVQQINALTEYNRMRDKLLDFLKSFKEKKEVVKEEDIKAFFANMKPKREPDGVYFCR